ncbi:uncharacterized protein BX663DRAFT_432883, partial [Cokeromyces recurvatus]|uniref:uncharacterized protein n=1 Tax=Cokeromyces recurvatus TaxID=90255 RepID=UPI0022204681
AAYKCAKIDTAYKNDIMLQFGNKLRMFVNLVTQQKDRTAARRKILKKQKMAEEEIKKVIKNKITQPCTQLKLSVASGNIQNLSVDHDHTHTRFFFGTYSSQYKFKNNDIYYDCKANPIAYYKLADSCESLESKSFACFPLRRTHTSCYVKNPRPHIQGKYPVVECHGLLR